MNNKLIKLSRHLYNFGLHDYSSRVDRIIKKSSDESCDGVARKIILKHLEENFPEDISIDDSGRLSEESLKRLNSNPDPDYLDKILDSALEEWHDAVGESYNKALADLGLDDWET
jgi:hypothetical protein